MFADRYDVPSLRRAIVDMYWAHWAHEAKLAAAATILALRNLPYESALCRLLVDLHIERFKPITDELCGSEVLLRQEMPAEFLLEVLTGLTDLDYKAENPKKVIKNLCAYHEHPQDED